MLFCGTEWNRCEIFRKMLKRGMDILKPIMVRYTHRLVCNRVDVCYFCSYVAIGYANYPSNSEYQLATFNFFSCDYVISRCDNNSNIGDCVRMAESKFAFVANSLAL